MNILLGRAVRSAALLLPLICFGDDSSKVSPDLAGIDPNALVNVIVQFVLPPSSQDNRGINQLGGVPQQPDLSLIRYRLYSIPAKAIAGLAHNPNIAYISPDRTLNPTLDYANATIGAQTAFLYGSTGSGIGVAII